MSNKPRTGRFCNTIKQYALRGQVSGPQVDPQRIRPCDLSVSRRSRRGGTAGRGLPAPAAERATRCRGFHAPSLLHRFPLQPAEPLPNRGLAPAAPPQRCHGALQLSSHSPPVDWRPVWTRFPLSHRFCKTFLWRRVQDADAN